MFFRENGGRVCTSRQFREALDREMLRAERYNAILTLMLIDVRGGDLSARDRKEAIRSLQPIAAAVTRRIDQIGWYDDGGDSRLGLILPNTQPSDTVRMRGEILKRFEELINLRGNGRLGQVQLVIEIYGYPVDGRTDETPDNHRQLLLFEDDDLLNPNKDGEPAETLAGHSSYPALARLHLGGWRSVPLWKRVMDIVGGGLILVAISPLFIAIAAAVKLTSRGPVFYKQERIGRRGRVFKMWKFRSMAADDRVNKAAHEEYLKQLLNRSANGIRGEMPMQKLGALDRRVTKIGKLLRVSSLDELPQLINVMRGEMSLVGPRPCLPYEARCYPAWCYRRFDAMPGLTGIWQISGKNRTTFKQMVRMDIDYARRMSPLRDLWILLMTGPTIAADVWRAVREKYGMSAECGMRSAE
ncbi:sugar transferase [bacterium]|nr:sugar transferase [bacterium]